MKDYIVGKNYKYSEIPEEDTEEYTVSNYGIDCLGQNAIHLRFHNNYGTDIWFVYEGFGIEAIYKCVYNS